MATRKKEPIDCVWARGLNSKDWVHFNYIERRNVVHFYVSKDATSPICGSRRIKGPWLDDPLLKSPQMCKRCLKLLAFGASGKRKLSGVDREIVFTDELRKNSARLLRIYGKGHKNPLKKNHDE